MSQQVSSESKKQRSVFCSKIQLTQGLPRLSHYSYISSRHKCHQKEELQVRHRHLASVHRHAFLKHLKNDQKLCFMLFHMFHYVSTPSCGTTFECRVNRLILGGMQHGHGSRVEVLTGKMCWRPESMGADLHIAG